MLLIRQRLKNQKLIHGTGSTKEGSIPNEAHQPTECELKTVGCGSSVTSRWCSRLGCLTYNPLSWTHLTLADMLLSRCCPLVLIIPSPSITFGFLSCFGKEADVKIWSCKVRSRHQVDRSVLVSQTGLVSLMTINSPRLHSLATSMVLPRSSICTGCRRWKRSFREACTKSFSPSGLGWLNVMNKKPFS